MPRSTPSLQKANLLSLHPWSHLPDKGEFCWYRWGRREYLPHSGNYALVLPEGIFFLPDTGTTGKLTEPTAFSLIETELSLSEVRSQIEKDRTRGVVFQCPCRPCRIDDGVMCSGIQFILDIRVLSETLSACPFLERLREKAYIFGPDFPSPEEIDECRKKYGDSLTCRALFSIYFDERFDSKISAAISGDSTPLSGEKTVDLSRRDSTPRRPRTDSPGRIPSVKRKHGSSSHGSIDEEKRSPRSPSRRS